MRLRRAAVRLARDDIEGALDDIRQTVPLARQAGDPQQRVPWFAGCTRLLVVAGKRRRGATARPRGPSGRRVRIRVLGAGRARVRRARARLYRGARRATRTRPADEVDRLPRAHCCETTSSRPPTCSTRSAMPSSSACATACRRAAARRRAAEPKPTSSCSARSRSGRSVRATRYIREAEALLAAASSADGGVERPAVGHALELVLAALLELDARPGHEVANGARHEHLVRLGQRGYTCSDVNRDAREASPRAASPPPRAARSAPASPLR